MQIERQRTQVSEASGFGETLRRERELRGFSLRDVANATKISISSLKALECSNFEALPGGAFTRGFVRAYAGYIGLDPEEMVNHYLFEVSGSSEGPDAEEGVTREEHTRRRQRMLAVTLAGAILLALAVFTLWYFLG